MYLNCPNSSGQETSDTEPLKKYSTVKTGLFTNFVKLNSFFADSGNQNAWSEIGSGSQLYCIDSRYEYF